MSTIVASTVDTLWSLFPSQKLIFDFCSKLRTGHLVFVLPNGEKRVFGNENEKPVTVTVHNQRFFSKIIRGSDVGLGESYMEGDWDCDDLTQLFLILVGNMHDDVQFSTSVSDLIASVAGTATGIVNWLRRNTPSISHDNVKAHYDLGNDFYELMLDQETMGYTCAIFNDPSETLTEAQLNKMRLVINKADLKPTDHVLELGCGWGGFAMVAASEVGCKVHAVNLSGEQIAWARQKSKERGLDHLITFSQMDYRATEGEAKYDKIVSIGMMEHVGHSDLPTFFETCDRLLKPDGIVVSHHITVLDQAYDRYIYEMDFIKAYIFPGCCIPSATAMLNAATSKSRFVCQHLENFGANYAKTLREWRRNFLTNKDKVTALGYDEKFQRMWDVYLTYCEAGFIANQLGLHHMVWTRPTVDKPYSLGRKTYNCSSRKLKQ